MDNIMYELYCQRNNAFVDKVAFLSLGTNLTMDDVDAALSELIAKNYVQKVDRGVRITELGECFCKSSSFCCNSKPIVM